MNYQPYFNPKAFSRTFWLSCSMVLAYALWACISPLQAAESQFRLQSSTVNVAAGQSTSSSFELDSCIDQLMAGTSKSASFQLQSGCGVAAQAARGSNSGEPTFSEEAIPLLSSWSTTVLTLLILLVSGLYLRPGKFQSL